MNDCRVVKVPKQVADYATDIARREYLRTSSVVQSLLMRGMLQHQLDEQRRRDGNK